MPEDYDYDDGYSLGEAYDEDKRYNSMAANRDKNGMTKTNAYKGPTVRNTTYDGTPTGTKSGFTSKANVPKG